MADSPEQLTGGIRRRSVVVLMNEARSVQFIYPGTHQVPLSLFPADKLAAVLLRRAAGPL